MLPEGNTNSVHSMQWHVLRRIKKKKQVAMKGKAKEKKDNAAPKLIGGRKKDGVVGKKGKTYRLGKRPKTISQAL